MAIKTSNFGNSNPGATAKWKVKESAKQISFHMSNSFPSLECPKRVHRFLYERVIICCATRQGLRLSGEAKAKNLCVYLFLADRSRPHGSRPRLHAHKVSRSRSRLLLFCCIRSAPQCDQMFFSIHTHGSFSELFRGLVSIVYYVT